MKWISYALPILLLASCGKIKTPNQEAKEIFGKWRFVMSSGGDYYRESVNLLDRIYYGDKNGLKNKADVGIGKRFYVALPD